ncbi:MAG: DUF799 family lipoprotein [Nitrospiraceae bacterium]|nr:DUF799 family lipoprotein [Nitrospiraceae bacterium]
MTNIKKIAADSVIAFSVLFSLSACGGKASTYWHDPEMDFGSVKTVAVMPFVNATRDQFAAERVRAAFINRLLATGGVYVMPKGEVARGISRAGITDPTAPSPEEIQKFAGIVKVDAVITGTVSEYGEVRSGTSAANVVSVSMQMIEAQTGRVVWSASSTKGGINVSDRLFGGGGQPMADVTGKAVDDIIDKLFK